MTVAQLLEMPEFSSFQLLAGGGNVDGEITAVNVIDSPDSHTFFRGGEFLLTNTYIMREDISILKDITVACANLGAAAIGIKLARFLRELPEDYIALADELQFPVILLPVDLPFEAVISRVYAEIVNSQVIRLKYSEQVHNSFTQLVLQGGSTTQILCALRELLGREVCYYDTYFEQYYDCHRTDPLAIDQAPWPLQHALSRYSGYPLEVSGSRYGFLVILDELPGQSASREHIDHGGIAIQHASTVLKLNCQKMISNSQINAKHQDEFIQELLLNSFPSQEVMNACKRIYGWHFTGGLIAIVINCGADTWNHNGYDLDAFLSRQIKQLYSPCMYTKLGDQLVFLIEPTAQPLPQFIAKLRESLSGLIDGIQREYALSLYVGVGSCKSSLREAFLSYREAQTAERIGQKLQQQFSYYDDLGIYRLLFQIQDGQSIARFLDKHIRKLKEYDTIHNSEYLLTLKVLIQNDWNLQKSAESLYLHYNTVKNRCYKIGEILSEDLRDPNVKINLAISVKLLQLGW